MKKFEIFCLNMAKLSFCGMQLAIHVSFMLLIGILNESGTSGPLISV